VHQETGHATSLYHLQIIASGVLINNPEQG